MNTRDRDSSAPGQERMRDVTALAERAGAHRAVFEFTEVVDNREAAPLPAACRRPPAGVG